MSRKEISPRSKIDLVIQSLNFLASEDVDDKKSQEINLLQGIDFYDTGTNNMTLIQSPKSSSKSTKYIEIRD